MRGRHSGGGARGWGKEQAADHTFSSQTKQHATFKPNKQNIKHGCEGAQASSDMSNNAMNTTASDTHTLQWELRHTCKVETEQ